MDNEKLKVILVEILQHYQRTRATGHSYAAKLGAKTFDRNINLVFQNYNHLRVSEHQGASREGVKAVTLDDFVNQKMCGNRDPLMFDNFTLITIFEQSLGRIIQLEEQVEELEDMLNDKPTNESDR